VTLPVYVADQLTKVWAVANLEPGQPQAVIGSILRLNLIRNSGAAFSIATGATWVLTVIACSVVIFILIIARRLGSRGWALALGLLLGGSLGNFNIADSAIVSAAVLIAVLAFRGISIDGTRAASAPQPPAGTDPDV